MKHVMMSDDGGDDGGDDDGDDDDVAEAEEDRSHVTHTSAHRKPLTAPSHQTHHSYDSPPPFSFQVNMSARDAWRADKREPRPNTNYHSRT